MTQAKSGNRGRRSWSQVTWARCAYKNNQTKYNEISSFWTSGFFTCILFMSCNATSGTLGVRMQRSAEPGRNRNGCNEMETEPSIPSASCCCSSHMTTSSPTILSAISRHKSPAVNLTHATCLVYNTPFIIFFFISASEKGSVLKHPLDFAVTSQDFSKEVGRSLHSVH